MPRRIKPDIPPGAAQKIAKALDSIDAPRPRMAARPGTDESGLAQAARLRDGNRQNMYGGMSMDYNGHRYATHGRSSGDTHAEGDMLDRMRRQIADSEGIPPDQVDLRRGSNARVYSEFSPCDTPKRNCQRLLEDSLPPGTEVTHSWPWNPRGARDASIDARDNAVRQLFQGRDPAALAILSQTGLPEGGVVPFYPADEPRPMDVEPAVLVVGNWGHEDIVIGVHTVDGRALGYTPWSPPLYRVNTSLRQFVECVEVINRTAPFTPERFGGNLKPAGERVLAALRRIDPEELGDPDSFWLDVIDDIKVGNFTPS